MQRWHMQLFLLPSLLALPINAVGTPLSMCFAAIHQQTVGRLAWQRLSCSHKGQIEGFIVRPWLLKYIFIPLSCCVRYLDK